jgi:putative endonuclease
MATKDAWYVYILQCKDGTYYTGSTNNVERRVEQHNLGNGAKYTRGRRPVKQVWSEICNSKSHALKREIQIKKWSRIKKEQFVKSKSV